MRPDDRWFFVDEWAGVRLRYSDLPSLVNAGATHSPFLRRSSAHDFLIEFIRTLAAGKDVVLLDADATDSEASALLNGAQLTTTEPLPPRHTTSANDIIEAVKSSSSRVTMFTSGTTGRPKAVTHPISSLLRSAKVGVESAENVWALTYNVAHMAGIQVVLQALLNCNPLINLFRGNRSDCCRLINTYKVTHVSATPTFYRLLLSSIEPLTGIVQVTLGGERSTEHLYNELRRLFPSARVANIYASTEPGAVLRGHGEVFTIDPAYEKSVRIDGNELLIHQSVVGSGVPCDAQGWYRTGDIVEVLTSNPTRLRFGQRAGDAINVGGYKVNPHEVEDALLTFPGVTHARVYGRANSVLGNVLAADVVVAVGASVEERRLREYLAERLQDFKVPRKFVFPESLDLTATGKVKRS